MLWCLSCEQCNHKGDKTQSFCTAKKKATSEEVAFPLPLSSSSFKVYQLQKPDMKQRPQHRQPYPYHLCSSQQGKLHHALR